MLKGPPIFYSHIHIPTTMLLVHIAREVNFNIHGQYVVIFITWAMQHLCIPIFTCQNTAAYRKYMFVIKNGETTKSWKEKQPRKTMLKYGKGMYENYFKSCSILQRENRIVSFLYGLRALNDSKISFSILLHIFIYSKC